MRTESSAGFRALAVDVATLRRQRRQRARVACAVVLVVATAVAFAAVEVSRWDRARPLGLELSMWNASTRVQPGSIAEAAGVDGAVIAIDGADVDVVHHGAGSRPRFVLPPHIIATEFGALYLRERAAETTVVVDDVMTLKALYVDATQPVTKTSTPRCDDGLPAIDDGDDGCPRPPRFITLRPDAPATWVRDGQVVDANAGVFCALAFVVAVAAGCVVRRRAPSLPPSPTLAERSVVGPAIAAAIVVPLWAHVAVRAWFVTVLEPDLYVESALILTLLPHLALVWLMHNSARRWARGEFGTRRILWPLVLSASVPGVALIVPTVLVLLVSAVVFLTMERCARRWIAGDAQHAG